jgi:hypothetical protein
MKGYDIATQKPKELIRRSLAHNVFGLGEVAEPKLNRITKLKN